MKQSIQKSFLLYKGEVGQMITSLLKLLPKIKKNAKNDFARAREVVEVNSVSLLHTKLYVQSSGLKLIN